MSLVFVSPPFRRTQAPAALSAAIMLALALACRPALAAPDPTAASSPEFAEFDAGFFVNHGGGGVDVSQYAYGNVVLPGSYETLVYRNGEWVGKQTLVFAAVPGQASAQLCLNREQLRLLGVDIDGIAEKAASVQQAAEPLPAEGACGELGRYVPAASVQFEAGENRLDLTVPQLYLLRSARGYVAPEHWDAGVNAGFLRYAASTYTSHSQAGSTRSVYLGLNGGLNLGRWHLRHSGSLSRQSEGGIAYQSNATYVQRSVPSLQAQLMAGETYTGGDLFASVRVLGVSLRTDDRMLPDSMTGYAPIIRGVAQTNARVSVRQRGILLQEVSVAAGPFIMEDLFPTGTGGDLEVTVTEADGREQRFIVPFASSAQLLRPGYGRYEISAGRLAETTVPDRSNLVQATYQYGLNNTVTGYVGAVAFAGYRSQLLGAAFNTPLGAISTDLTLSQADVAGMRGLHGHALQVRYNKHLAQTGTNFALGAYRYSTENYLSVIDAAHLRSLAKDGGGLGELRRLRDRMDISLSQQLGQGTAYLSGSTQSYWNRRTGSISFSAGYGGAIGRVNYNVSLQRSRELLSDRDDTRLDLSLSLPLGHATRAPSFSAALSEGARQRNLRAGVNGSFGGSGQYAYNAGVNHDPARGTGFGAGLDYRGPLASVSGDFSSNDDYRTLSLDVSGGVVVHAGGVIFTPELGDTIGLVHVPKGKGTTVNGNTAGRVNGRGYGVMPHLTPFRNNSVELDPSGASHDVALESASHNVAPYAGAVVLLPFKTSNGLAMLIRTLDQNGAPLPFGANVFDEDGNNVGVVGQAGKAFVRTVHPQGELTVRWGSRGDQQCVMPYVLQEQGNPGELRQLQGQCSWLKDAPLATAERQPPMLSDIPHE